MNLNIFIVCHKQSKTLNSKIFRPIQVGAKNAKQHFAGYLHDDEGDNISEKNPYYCELTGMYWVWKHIECDYYGFMHYRRYFSFSDIMTKPYADYPSLNANFMKEHNYNEKEIQRLVEKYDIIAPKSETMAETVYEQYKNSRNHHVEDLDLVLNIVREKYPDCTEAVQKYMNGKQHYFCNMFIMKKTIFQDYCSWLFSILEEHEKRSSRQDYNLEETRVSGFLSERLFGIYYTFLKITNENLKYKEIPRLHFQHTDIQLPIVPIQTEKEIIPVVFSVNEAFMPYLAVTIQSIIAHRSEQYLYHLVILHNGGLSENSMIKMQAMLGQVSNFRMQFYHVGQFLEDKAFFVDKHLSLETYFRLFIQDILPFYDKVLYLDCDLVVQHDVSDLYHIAIADNYLAAAKDIDYMGCWKLDQERQTYTSSILQLTSGLKYFQAGVLIFNLQEFRKKYSVEALIDIAVSKQWQFHDQDILNYICQDKVHYLPQQWNVIINWKEPYQQRMDILKQAPKTLFDEYSASRKKPFIIHFAGYQKPWNMQMCDYDYVFWQYARKTTFYEQILANFINEICKKDEIDASVVNQVLNNKPLLNRVFPPGSRRRDFAKKIKKMLNL